MRLLRSLRLFLSAADDGSDCLYDRTMEATSTAATDFAKSNSGQLALAASGGTAAIPLGQVVTAKAIQIETDQEIDVVFNGGADTLKITPPTGAQGVLYWEGNFTGIQVTNNGSQNASVTYAVAGV